MRKLIVGVFTSLDGVMQAPGGPDGRQVRRLQVWRLGCALPAVRKRAAAVGELFQNGRSICCSAGPPTISFAAYWPYLRNRPQAVPGYDAGSAHIANTFNAATKFVATHHPDTLTWNNSQATRPRHRRRPCAPSRRPTGLTLSYRGQLN